MPDNRAHLNERCTTIADNSWYTAETHFIIANQAKTNGRLLKYALAALSALSGTLLLSGLPGWIAWLSILSGLTTAVAVALDSERTYNDHCLAAKMYTVLKHDAWVLRDTLHFEMGHVEMVSAVERLQQRYNDLVLYTPATNDKAYERAKAKLSRDQVEEKVREKA
jgi:hypothetical protein